MIPVHKAQDCVFPPQNYGVVSSREAHAALKENGSPVSIFIEEIHQCNSVCVGVGVVAE